MNPFSVDDDDLWDDFASEVVACPECGEEVYEDAEQCPLCGAYIVQIGRAHV